MFQKKTDVFSVFAKNTCLFIPFGGLKSTQKSLKTLHFSGRSPGMFLLGRAAAGTQRREPRRVVWCSGEDARGRVESDGRGRQETVRGSERGRPEALREGDAELHAPAPGRSFFSS